MKKKLPKRRRARDRNHARLQTPPKDSPPHRDWDPAPDEKLVELLRGLGSTASTTPPPTPQEVIQLLRYSAVALRRLQNERAKRLALIIDLLRWSLSSKTKSHFGEPLDDVVGKLFYALNLKNSPIGDAIEDDLGRAGRTARAGARLQWLVEQQLSSLVPLELAAHDGDEEKTIAVMARHLAFSLSNANGMSEILPQASPLREPPNALDEFAPVIAEILRKRINPRRGPRRALTQLVGSEGDRAYLAQDVVVAVASHCGFPRARERLFDADRKRMRSADLRLV